MEIFCDTQINEIMHNRVYFYKSLSLYNGFIETYRINNQKILYFVNLWSK